MKKKKRWIVVMVSGSVTHFVLQVTCANTRREGLEGAEMSNSKDEEHGQPSKMRTLSVAVVCVSLIDNELE